MGYTVNGEELETDEQGYQPREHGRGSGQLCERCDADEHAERS